MNKSLKQIKITEKIIKELGFKKVNGQYQYRGETFGHTPFHNEDSIGKQSLFNVIQEIIEYEKVESEQDTKRKIREAIGLTDELFIM